MSQRPRAILWSTLLAAAACSDTRAEDFATYADAKAAPSDTHAPLPAFVPASAFEIRSVLQADSGRQWLRFKVPHGDTTVVHGAASYPLRVAPEAGPPRQMGRWSPELRDPPLMWQNGSRVRTYQHQATVRESAWCFAFDHSSYEVFAWSCTRSSSGD